MRNLQEVVAYKKWSLWETVDCSRAAGCGGEGNDGGVDWYVDGDSGCGSYCFGGGEGIEIKLKWRYDCPSCNTNLSNNCNWFVTPPPPRKQKNSGFNAIWAHALTEFQNLFQVNLQFFVA